MGCNSMQMEEAKRQMNEDSSCFILNLSLEILQYLVWYFLTMIFLLVSTTLVMTVVDFFRSKRHCVIGVTQRTMDGVMIKGGAMVLLVALTMIISDGNVFIIVSGATSLLPSVSFAWAVIISS